ncbi:TetR/AcrR family transcriptional regulator [Amycolatopsis sp. NPDC003676]
MANSAGSKGMPRPERERLILDAAVQEFGTQGYAHASVAAIARRAEISKPLVYGYFDSKDGLYLACLHRGAAPLVDAVTEAQTGTGLTRALGTLEAIFRTLEPRRLDWAVLWDPTLPPNSAVDEAARSYRRKLSALGAEGTQEALSTAGFADPADASLFARIWYGAVAATVNWWLEHPEEPAEVTTQRCARILASLRG